MSETDKRRIVLIDHRFQLRMTAAFIGLQLVLTAIFAFALYLFMDSELHADLASAHASYQSLSRMLLPIVLTLAGFSVTLSIVLITVFVVLLSHRLAGPMYRLRSALEALAQRRLDAMTRLRRGDQLGEVARSLEQATNTVNHDIRLLRQTSARLRAGLDTGDAEAIAREAAAIEQVLNAWQKAP